VKYVISVAATAPLSSTGGQRPKISLSGIVPVGKGGTGNSNGVAVGFSGNLGGDVTGAQGGTRVVGLQGTPVSSTQPTDGQVLQYNAAQSQWQPSGSSSAYALRSFYLTQSGFQGNSALTACSTGYHMATFAEIFNPADLKYNTNLGYTQADSGSGPPTGIIAWVRTGYVSGNGGSPGEANCNVWTSNSTSDKGTYLILDPVFGNGGGLQQAYPTPWVTNTVQCSNASVRVWCVED
jgi:hypothetical protein